MFYYFFKALILKDKQTKPHELVTKLRCVPYRNTNYIEFIFKGWRPLREPDRPKSEK